MIDFGKEKLRTVTRNSDLLVGSLLLDFESPLLNLLFKRLS